VASAAGCSTTKYNSDAVGIDWTLQSENGDYPRKYPKLDVQLKCTSTARPNGHVWGYNLEVKNYKKLQGVAYDNARILVVVYVPSDVESWLQQSDEELIVRHCGYWISLRGAPETSNSRTQAIEIPRANQFTVEALQSMMDTIGNGGFP
jgi:hypothetical protein